MAKKQVIDENLANVKKAIEEGKAIIGTDRTLKELKNGSVAVVYVSKNCPEETRNDLKTYAQMTEAEVIELEYPDDEFATLCKKPFPISVIGIIKE